MPELTIPHQHMCDWCNKPANFVSVNAKKYRCVKSVTQCPGFVLKCETTRSKNTTKENRVAHMRQMNSNAIKSIKEKQTDPLWRRKRGENISKAKSQVLPEQKSEYAIYENLVDRITRDSWNQYQKEINPSGLIRGREYELDHRYSKMNGWLNKVPPEVIGHWTNLELLPRYANRSKRTQCSVTLEDLYDLISRLPY